MSYTAYLLGTLKKWKKPKEQAEAGPSRKIIDLADNTRKVAEHSQTSGSSIVVKKTRKKGIVSRAEVKGDGEKVKGHSSHKKEVRDDEKEKKKTKVQTSTPTKKKTRTQ